MEILQTTELCSEYVWKDGWGDDEITSIIKWDYWFCDRNKLVNEHVEWTIWRNGESEINKLCLCGAVFEIYLMFFGPY